MKRLSNRRALLLTSTVAAATAAFACLGLTAGRASTSVVGSSSNSAAGSTLVVLDSQVAPGMDADGANNDVQETVQSIINTADPLLTYPTRKVGDVLVPNYNATPSQFTPMLATSWSKKKNTWTFHLRRGVKSCAGNTLTADDVVYTFARAISVSGTSPASWFIGYVSGLWSAAPIAPKAPASAKVLHGQVKKVNKYTVQIKQMAPNDLFPRILTLYGLSIWDSKLMKSHATKSDPWSHQWAETNASPGLGFGPYCLSKWVKGQEMDLTANPHYWRGQPTFTTVKILTTPSGSNRVASLLTGSAQVALNLSPQEYSRVTSSSNTKVLSWQNDIGLYLGLNYKDAPWNSRQTRLLRQAVAYAIPYDQIIHGVLGGKAQRWNTNCGTNNAYGAVQFKQYNTNIAKAKQLIAKAGFPNGKGLPSAGLTLYYSSDESEWMQPIASYLRTSLAQIGINIKLSPITGAELGTHLVVKRDLPMVMDDVDRPLVPDVGYCGLLWYVSKKDGGRLYNVNYSNRTYDKLYNESAKTTGSARLPILRKMQQITMTDLPKIPIAERDSQIAVSKNVTGWQGDSQDLLHFWAFKTK